MNRPPNILVLVTDDQRWDTLGCMGHPFLKTPHIDRLAAEGVTFTQAFVTTSICSASRASIVSGRYARRHGVGMSAFGGSLPADAWAESFPVQLKRAGYRLGCVGKWGFGDRDAAALFDFWNAWEGQGSFFQAVGGEKVHNSEFLARQAEEFLRAGPPDRPWCLVVLYKSPHEPFQPDPRDEGLLADARIEPPPTYTDEHFRALPQAVQQSEGRARLLKRHPTPGSYAPFVRRYLQCIAGVDRSVGRILAALDALGQTDSTLTLYTSDNGFFLGEHGLSGKWFAYEESIRVPLLARWGGVAGALRGQRVDAMALNLDLAPTILDAAGLGPPRGMDGRSLRPLLAGRRPPWRQDFFYEHHYWHGGKIPRTEAVRTTTHKYIRYIDPAPAIEELYDLRADPREARNLAPDPAAAATLEAMRAMWREHLRRLGPAGPA